MRRTVPSLLAVILVMAACSGESPGLSVSTSQPASQAPSEAASTTPSASAQPSEAPSASAETPAETSAEPIPSDSLGAFTCDLPIVEDASVALANIVDVRVGSHDGYDRAVVEFEQGTPELTLARATPPFSEDASGLPLDVEGDSFLALTMRGGSRQTDAGTSSYDGPTDFDPAFPMLVDLIEGGDFERQSTWYLGLTDEACARVTLLDDPPRVVIDVER